MQAPQQLPLLKNVLALVSAEDIVEKIRNFRRLEFRTFDDKALANEILKVLSVSKPDGTQSAFLKIHLQKVPVGTMFFRARRAADTTIPPPNGRLVRDSEPPDGSQVKRGGRLHKSGEPLLYTAIDHAHVTLSECRIQVGSHAVIFGYRARKVIAAPLIGAIENGLELTPAEKFKLNLLNDFLHDEFSREVESGLEHLYRPSEIIAKWWFDGPPQFQDCWIYSSTKDRRLFNAAFRPNKAHECLNLVGSMLVERTGADSFSVLAVGKPNKKRLDYFPSGSRQHRELFPQFPD